MKGFNIINRLFSKYFSSSSIAGNALQIYFIQFFSILVGLLSGIIIARVMGPAEKGTYNLFGVVNTSVNEIGLLGIGYGFLYQLANKKVPLEKIHGSAIMYSLFAGVTTALIGFVSLPFLQTILPGLKDWMILLPFLTSPAGYYMTLTPFLMIGVNKATNSYKINFIIALLTLAATITLWLSGVLDAASMITAYSLIVIVNSLISFVLLTKINPRFKPDFFVIKDSLKYGSIIYVGAIANIIHFKADQIMINYWIGPGAVGIYALSVYWAEKLFLLDSALNSAALYRISSSSPSESIILTNKVFRFQLIISGLGGLIVSLVSYPLIVVVYGNSYHDAILPLVLLIPGIIAWSVSKVQSGMINFNFGLGTFIMKVALLGSVINIILNVLLLGVMGYGIIACSVASSLSYITVALLIFWKSKKLLGKSNFRHRFV